MKKWKLPFVRDKHFDLPTGFSSAAETQEVARNDDNDEDHQTSTSPSESLQKPPPVDPTLEKPSHQKRWDTMFNKLVAFKARYNHCNVPREYEEDKPLGIWVMHQRRAKAMPARRVAALDSIGFQWEGDKKNRFRKREEGRESQGKNKDKWDSYFEKLKAFKEQNGHTKVPRNYAEDPALGVWVKDQRVRKATMPPRRVAALDGLGFLWNGFASEKDDAAKPPAREDGKTTHDHQWEQQFERLVQFKAKHGHTNVPRTYHEDPALARWVRRQREWWKENKLPKDRKSALDGVGFVFMIRPTTMQKKTKKDDNVAVAVETRTTIDEETCAAAALLRETKRSSSQPTVEEPPRKRSKTDTLENESSSDENTRYALV